MDSAELIELFYNRTYEKFVNKQILDDKNYIVPRQQLINYVHELINIPYIDFIEYLKNRNEKIIVNSTDITHFSNFSSCEIDMCNALIWATNPGCTFVEIGRLFPENVSSRNEIAYRNYGEKHIKAATQLGLTFEYYDYWYLSCIGYVYPDLNENDRLQLLARTITRNNLYRNMLVDIMDHDVYPELYLTMFSGSSLKCRIKNVVTFLDICIKECELNHIITHRLYRRNANIDSSVSSDSLYSNKIRPIYRLYRSYELLSYEEVITLFQKYNYRGDLNAFDTLVKSYLRLVLSIAKLFENKGLGYDDLIQEGILGLIKAIKKYDYIHGISFGFYAKTWIKQSIIQAINIQSLTVQIPQNQLALYKKVRKEIERYEQKNGFIPSFTELEIGEDVDEENLSYIYNLPDNLADLTSNREDWDEMPSSDFGTDELLMKESRVQYVNSLLENLKKREADILRCFFGIGTKEETLDEIGNRMYLTRERVRQIKEKAISNLRKILLLQNNKEQDDQEDKEPKEKELTVGETKRIIHVQKVLLNKEKRKSDSLNYDKKEQYRIINNDKTFEIRGKYNTLLFGSKGYVRHVNGVLYCFKTEYTCLYIFDIKMKGREVRVGEMLVRAHRNSDLYQLLIGNEYDKIEDIKQNYSNKKNKVFVGGKWYDNSGCLIIEQEKIASRDDSLLKKIDENNALYILRENNKLDGIKVGDRIVYNEKECTICKILVRGDSSRLLLKYDNGVFDDVPNNKSLYRKALSRNIIRHNSNVIVDDDKRQKNESNKTRTSLSYNGHEFSWNVGDFVALGFMFSGPINIQGDPFFLFRRNILFVFMKSRTAKKTALDSKFYLLPTDTRLFKKNFSAKYDRKSPRILFFTYESPTAAQFLDEVIIQRIDANFIEFKSLL